MTCADEHPGPGSEHTKKQRDWVKQVNGVQTFTF